jgi:hypothetical protein
VAVQTAGQPHKTIRDEQGNDRAELLEGRHSNDLQEDLKDPAWLFFALQRERLCCEDEGDRDSLWYSLVIRGIKAVRRRDMAEAKRVVNTLAKCAETQNK